MFTISRWVRHVLDQYNVTLYDMNNRRRQMSAAWNCRQTPVDYGDPVTQAAYIRTDVCFRAHFITKLLRTHPVLCSIFADNFLPGGGQGVVGITCIGCGPGTEMIGIINFLLQTWTTGDWPMGSDTPMPSTMPSLRFICVDRVTTWSKPVEEFEKAVRIDLAQSDCNLNFEKSFYTWNLARQPDMENPLFLPSLPSCASSNIFIFSMIFSDLLKEGATAIRNAVENVRSLFENAMTGAFFLFIDLEDKLCVESMQDILQSSGVFTPENSIKNSDYFGTTLPWTQEHRKELGQYFGNGNPKLTGRMFCLLYTKRQVDPGQYNNNGSCNNYYSNYSDNYNSGDGDDYASYNTGFNDNNDYNGDPNASFDTNNYANANSNNYNGDSTFDSSFDNGTMNNNYNNNFDPSASFDAGNGNNSGYDSSTSGYNSACWY